MAQIKWKLNLACAIVPDTGSPTILTRESTIFIMWRHDILVAVLWELSWTRLGRGTYHFHSHALERG